MRADIPLYKKLSQEKFPKVPPKVLLYLMYTEENLITRHTIKLNCITKGK